MKEIGIYLILILLLLSCKDDFTVSINPEKISKNEVRVVINTNFPDSTIFSLTAERLYKRKNNSNIYGGTHFFSREYPVKNGIVEFTFKVNDSAWIKDYNEHREFEIKTNPSKKELTEIDYESIKDSLEISVFYNPIFERNESVKKIVGEKGKNLNGMGTFTLDEGKKFRISKKIHWKFE